MEEKNKQDIRFIDSRYNELFKLPDGGFIQVDYPKETVIKQCVFIDQHHTQIGYNVFHIRQYAESMERQGVTYQAEPEIMGHEAAWKIGRDKYLAIQTCDEGYNYSLLNEHFLDMESGVLENPELSMLEARAEILKLLDLAPKELRAMVYEKVMERSFEEGRHAVISDPLKKVTPFLDNHQLKDGINTGKSESFSSLLAQLKDKADQRNQSIKPIYEKEMKRT